jgi:DNA-binding NtrC family response regulator
MSTFINSSESIAIHGIVGSSLGLQQLLELCGQVAKSSVPVLMVGPSGSEFELFAAYIHSISERASAPFVRQRCISWQDLTDPLKVVGGGTLFVEGIEHAPMTIQLKLLEELEEARTFSSEPVSSRQPRMIVATSCELEDLVSSGLFLDDLFWQLSALTIRIPSLRERAEDIPVIVRRLLSELVYEQSEQRLTISSEVMKQIQAYSWPGNYRELRSRLQGAVVLAKDGQIQLELPPTGQQAGSTGTSSDSSSPNSSGEQSVARPAPADFPQLIDAVVKLGIKEADKSLREPYGFIVSRIEQALIASILGECENVQTKAAVRLGINRNTLHKKIKEYGLE